MTFDAEFLRRLTEGDPRTVQVFLDYFGPRIQAVLRHRLRGHADVDDLRQETFVRTLATLHRLREAERLPGFVLAICTNVWREHRRRDKRHPSGADGDVELADGRGSAESSLVRSELVAKVSDVLRELPARDRALLRAVFLDNRDRDVVCRELGVDRDYLRVLLHRAKQRFGDAYRSATAPRTAPPQPSPLLDPPSRESASRVAGDG